MFTSTSHKPAVVAWLLPFVVAIIVSAIGINWGLPTRADDAFLFGDRTPWTGAEILAMTGGWTAPPDGAADHDANPLADRGRTLVVNATDAQRAEIVQRFRLYSHQPDEMLTLRAIAQMRPDRLQLDPRMYQYGGLWVYPVAGLLKAGAACGLLTMRGDVAYYLDQPEQFGRFYVVMRAYSALWGLVGLAATMLILRRMSGSLLTICLGGIAFAFMPVVVNMAHEAKPHLAGAALLLWTVLAGTSYVRRGAAKHAAIAGACWGAATGMVLLSLPGAIVLVVMVFIRPQGILRRLKHLTVALVAGGLVYGLTNPYVVLNAWHGSTTLRSNMTAHGNFYRVGQLFSGIFNGVDLIAEGATLLVTLAGGVAVIVGVRRLLAMQGAAVDYPRKAMSLLLAAPVLLVLAHFVLLGADKPGEYGRFALLPCIALLITAFAGVANWSRHAGARVVGQIVLCAWVVMSGSRYVANLAADSGPFDTRTVAAEQLAALAREGGRGGALAIVDEPAPYCMPPVDLFRWQVMLLPRGAAAPSSDAGASALLMTVDRHRHPPAGWQSATPAVARQILASRISWANKPVDLFVPAPTVAP